MKLRTIKEIQKEKSSLISAYKYYTYQEVIEQNIQQKLAQLMEEEKLMTTETTETTETITTTTTSTAIEKARNLLEKVFSLSPDMNLYLINDDGVNGYIVIQALQTEIGLDNQTALGVTMEAHYNGKSVIISGKRNKLQDYKKKLDKYYISTEIK